MLGPCVTSPSLMAISSRATGAPAVPVLDPLQVAHGSQDVLCAWSLRNLAEPHGDQQQSHRGPGGACTGSSAAVPRLSTTRANINLCHGSTGWARCTPHARTVHRIAHVNVSPHPVCSIAILKLECFIYFF